MPRLFVHQDPQSLLAKIQFESAKNQQLVGHFKLRAAGIKKLLGSVEFDVIAKQPHYLYLSIDSFFKQPARIVTYDGTQLYGIEEDKLEAILTLPITPEELVEIFLRSFSPNPKDIKVLSVEENTLCIQYRTGYYLTLSVNLDYQIQKRELRDNSDQLIYSVTYEDFPKRFYLEANYKNQKHAMSLTSQDARINQGTFDEQLFRR